MIIKRLLVGALVVSAACSSKGSKSGGTGGAGTGATGGSAASGTGGSTAGSGGSGSGGNAAGSGGSAAGSGGSTVGSGGSTVGTGGSAAGSGGSGSGGRGGATVGSGGSAVGSGGSGNGGSGTTTGASVLERNNHPSRDGAYVQSMLTKAMAAKMSTDAGFTATFTGSMRASPLYLENGPNGKGAYYAATASNNVIALDETTGAMLWTKNVGAAPTMNGVSCGDIHPIGIISTPVIDPKTRTIYVAGAIGTTSITAHQAHALSVDDGSERAGWPVDIAGITNGSGVAFSPAAHNQRSALSLIGGILYIAYGGHNGDCGTYHGWVMGIDTATPTRAAAWPTAGEGDAIWAAGGMASDGTSLFATTGDNHPRLTNHLDSEEVVRISGLAVVDSSMAANVFYPTSWPNMDNTDADFGANSPVFIQVPDASGGNVRSYVVAVTKDGQLFVLDPKNLGGMGGQIANLAVASGGAMVVHTALASYTTAKGSYVTFTTDSGAQCPAGGASGTVVMSVLIPPGASPKPTVAWCVATGGAGTARGAGFNLPASPMATTTDGKSEAMVWFINGGKLNAVDGDTGAKVYTSADTCAGVRQWTAPIAVKGHVVVGADGQLCSWSPH